MDGDQPLLEQEHESLLLFLYAAPVGLIQAQIDGTIELINGASAKLLQPLAVGGQLDNLYTVLGPVVPGLAEQVSAYTSAYGTVCEGVRVSLPGGGQDGRQTRWVALSVLKLYGLRLMAVLVDITAQVQAEQALRDSQNRLRFTLDAVQVGDWDLDLASGELHRSIRHDRLFGHQRRPLKWGIAQWLAQVHEEDRALFQHSLDRALAGDGDWQIECRVQWPDGSWHWLDLRGHVELEGEVPVRLAGIVQDVTARREAENLRVQAERLAAENEQLVALSQMKSQFLSTMSHELRTPLNAVIGFADLLREGVLAQDPVRQQEFLRHIAQSGRHLLQLINDVLDLSKVDAGKMRFQPAVLDLGALIDEVCGVLGPALSRKQLGLSRELAADLPPLFLDAHRLRQVLYNYLANAIKFTPLGGHITVRARPDGPDHVWIEVEDTGMGIAAEELPRLFSEFHQVDGGHTRQHEGTGLGLALCRRLIEAQGGRVGVRSTPGQGSCFYLRVNAVHGHDLPEETPEATVLADTARPEAPQARSAPGQATAPLVLLVDAQRHPDAPWVRTLSEAGFEVDWAETTAQARRHARGTAYDAIALGLQLPDGLSLDSLAEIRSDGASRHAPVMALGLPGAVDTPAAFAVADVLSKPLRSDEILLAMQRLQGLAERPARVMVVDADAASRHLMAATLSALRLEAVLFEDGAAALAALDEVQPQALVLDLMLPGIDGFSVLHELRQRPAWRRLPVFIWTHLQLSAADTERLRHAAQDIISKGGADLALLLDDLRDWTLRR